LPSDGLFAAIFVPEPMREAVSGRAWLQALLDAERALAAAEARAGVIPAAAAEAIAACCLAERYDADELGVAGRAAGNPVEPLVRALREAVGGDARDYVHWGATSQDVLDTASMLVARRALELVLADTDAVARACARLADEHRSTLVAGRTLLQHAVPTTFGLKAAGWLVGVLDARRLATDCCKDLEAQLGGAAGTLAALGEDGLAVLGFYSEELGLGEPVLPWHTVRTRVAQVAGALDLTAGVLGKIALDVALLAQTEVDEVAESGAGGSSTMPHKRNPVAAARAAACARHVHALAGLLTGALVQEHERALSAWHAEWPALSDALALTGGAAASIRESLEGLRVDPERMRRNLGATRGLIMAERLAFTLARRLGRTEADALVRDLCARALESGRPLSEELREDERAAGVLSPEEVEAVFDPAGYLGSAETFVDRALARFREELEG
jgi:3-carboxy-cis,cis-muconate cycloisomerase